MGVVSGVVRTHQGTARGVLVEVFSVPDHFQAALPVKDRRALADLSPSRLGSALSDEVGQFSISYEHPSERPRSFFTSRAPANLWLTVSVSRSAGRLELVHQEADVRRRAAPAEHFVVLLDEATSTALDGPPGPATFIDPGQLKVTAEAELAISEDVLERSRKDQAKRAATRAEFHGAIANTLRAELTAVTRDSSGKALDPHFIDAGAAVRVAAEARQQEAVRKRFEVEAADPMVLAGRVSLSADQLAKVEAAGSVDGDSVTISEDELHTILREEGDGTNPELSQASITRREAVRSYCRDRGEAEECLDGDTDRGGSDGRGEPGGRGGSRDDEPVPITEPQPGDGADRLGPGITAEQLGDDIPTYIARVLDGDSSLDLGLASLSAPGDQLGQDEVAAAGSFPTLTLPPGPADIPAFYDFHDLQIAFKPVWMEALDENLISSAANAYERYVELGGDKSAAAGAKSWTDLVTIFEATMSIARSKPPQLVTRFIEVTSAEWNVLPADHRGRLQALASAMNKLYTLVQDRKGDGHNYSDGVGNDDLSNFERTVKYVEGRVEVLQAQARRIVRFARSELEERTAGISPVPSHRILTALKSRALSHYPATFFAANRKERSVNFGLLVTYRQHWTPTAYQVGELVKSIPLAPKEIRKYSKKIVLKEKRSRKEVESNLESQRSETTSTSRAEAEIVQRAMDRTNFNATVNGSFQIGVYNVGGSNAFTQDAEKNSAETKKSFHESVVKAAREYKNERKVELETETSLDTEVQETGELMNPNDELCVTYLFYELQRRYRVNERLHRLTSVVLVAQEMPRPDEVDEDWIIAHRWILNRVLLDDSFREPLRYVAENLVAEEHALAEMHKSLAQQRNLVEELKEDIVESRSLVDSRYGALQRSMERSARAAEHAKGGGGLFGFAEKFTSLGAVTDFADRLFGNDDEAPEAARIREAATRDAYERELQRLRDVEGRIAASNASLGRATEEYTARLAAHLGQTVLVSEFVNHLIDNLSYYMQAIWLHEPADQRWLRLKDTPVPVFERNARQLVLSRAPLSASLARLTHLRVSSHEFTTTAGVKPVPPSGELPTVPLYEVADIDALLGFKANYMIFAMKKPNALTDFMMEPYVERAASGFGITDPDDFGNMTLDEFTEYVCCLRRKLDAEEFDALREMLKEQLRRLLQSPLRDDEEIIVPLDALFIEALPGTKPILENFKLLHRQIDAADAQEDLRLKQLEKIRYAERILSGELGDPEVEGQYLFQGVENGGVTAPTPGGTGGSGRSGGGNP